MRNGFLGSLALLLAGAGFVLADQPNPTSPPSSGAGAPAAASPAAPTAPAMDSPAPPKAKAEEAPRPDRVYFNGEFLGWWTREMKLPPLVSTGTLASGGVLGAQGASVLVGNANFDNNFHTGGRFTLGSWVNEERNLGVEASYFILGRSTPELNLNSANSTLLARPFINATTGTPAAAIFGVGNVLNGVFDVLAAATRVEDLQLNARAVFITNDRLHIDLLAGFRYFDVEDGLYDAQASSIGPNSILPTLLTTTVSTDKIDTRNRFYGGQIGAEAEFCRGRWYAGLAATIALGENHETVNINGATTILTSLNGVNTITNVAASPLSLATNRGQHSHDEFAVVPELKLKLGFRITDFARAYVGYDFVYLSEAVRTGDQIDRVINLSQVPAPLGPGALVGPARPAFSFHETDFWAQGFNFGLEFHY